MVQIRYSGNSDIANALRGCFNRSYAYIKSNLVICQEAIKKEK